MNQSMSEALAKEQAGYDGGIFLSGVPSASPLVTSGSGVLEVPWGK